MWFIQRTDSIMKKNEQKNAPITVDSFKKEFVSCLPQGTKEPTQKEIKAFMTITEYYPTFREKPNGIKLLAEVYSCNSELSKAVLNGWYKTAETHKK